MKARSVATVIILTVACWVGLHAYQSGRAQYYYEMQNPMGSDPPDANEKSEFAFARLRYESRGGRGRGSWGTDSNKAERIFVQGIRRLSRINARSVEEIIDINSDEVFNWPWIYAVEVGRWSIDDVQAKRLRNYFDRGGFLMVDDFHGTYQWDAFAENLARIFPDRPVLDIESDHPIFHVLFDLDKRVQVPGRQYIRSGETYEQDGIEPKWRGIFDKDGRIQVAICHNMDLGDAWEWADTPEYPEQFASLAYRIGLNYVVYPMTH